MKKILALVLSVLMIASLLCACGGNETAETEKSAAAQTEAQNVISEETEAGVEETLGDDPLSRCKAMLGDTVSLDSYDEPDVDEESVFIYSSKDAKLDYTITPADGTTFQLPMKYQDLLDAGWTCDQDYLLPENMDADYETGIYYSNANGDILVAILANPTDAVIPVEESWITGIYVGEYYGSAQSFSVSGITPDSTVADIISALGEPSVIYYEYDEEDEEGELNLTYDGDFGSLDIEVDEATGTVTDVEYYYNKSNID